MARLEHPSGDSYRDLRLRQRNKLVERYQLSSCMNATKWAEVFPLTQWGLPMHARMIDDPPHGAHDVWESLGNADWIEWLEFDPIRSVQRGGLLKPEIVGDDTERLLAVLREINAPTSIEDGWIRVWGYLRPGTAPKWVIPSPPPTKS